MTTMYYVAEHNRRRRMGIIYLRCYTKHVVWQAGNDNFDVAIMVAVVAFYGVARSRWSSYCNYFG